MARMCTVAQHIVTCARALRFSASPRVGMVPNITHFLAFAVILVKSGHLRVSQTPSRWMCYPVQGIAMLNIVKSVALQCREIAFATSKGRQRVGERESHHDS